MNILLTGINSFIGCNLGRYLADSGHNVYGTVRNLKKVPSQVKWLKKNFIYELDSPTETLMFKDIDVVVHLIHDFRSGKRNLNIQGTQALCLTAKNSGVQYQVFISSYSAQNDAISEYGRTKYALELFFRRKQGIIIRPGLVLGNGGLFRRMVTLVQHFPVLPIPDEGKGMVPIIDIDTLCKSIVMIIENKLHENKEFNLFHNELVSLKYLLQQICHITKRKIIFINLPSGLLLLPLVFFQKIGIRLPISSDNLKGYIINKDGGYFSNLKEVFCDVPSLNYMIQTAIFDITGNKASFIEQVAFNKNCLRKH
jgi:nucleoside-diphosphate-sugar epimerase